MTAVLVVLFIAALLGGTLALSRWTAEPCDALDRLLFGGAAWLGIVAYAIAVMGLAGFFGRDGITLIPGAIALFAALGLLRRKPWSDFSLPRLSVWEALLALTITVLAFLTLTAALGPATSNEWDALAYHLAAPKVWMEAGRIGPIPYDHHSNFPFLTEMLFSIGLAWNSVPAAKLVHWVYAMLGALACFWAGRRWVSRTAGLLAAALFLAAPIVVWEAGIAYIDLASTVYAALAVFAFLRWQEERTNGWLLMAGLMAGFAAGTKMTMVATSGLLVLWAVGCAVSRRATWQPAGIVAGVALLIGAPWYIKTWLYTGNPVYPFAYGIFGGRWWDAQAAVVYAAEQARFGIGKTAYGLWMAPWTTAFFAQYYANPPAVYAGALRGAEGANVFPAVFGSLGLGIIAFLPLWLLAPGLRRTREDADGNGALAAMVLYCGAFGVVWFGLTHQTRYLMVLLPLLLVPGAAGFRAFWKAGAAWRWGLAPVAAIALLWGILGAWALAEPVFPVVWGGQSAGDYLAQREPIYVVSRRINEQLPPDAKILMMQEVRGFYLDRAYQWGNPEQNALIPWDALDTPEAMDAALREQGITHALVNWGALDRSAPRPRWARLIEAAAAKGAWTPVMVMGNDPQGGFAVYALQPEGPTGETQ